MPNVSNFQKSWSSSSSSRSRSTITQQYTLKSCGLKNSKQADFKLSWFVIILDVRKFKNAKVMAKNRLHLATCDLSFVFLQKFKFRIGFDFDLGFTIIKL